jgi:lactate dehydrogenase-like 2-hydroxyacid dehydrogenase
MTQLLNNGRLPPFLMARLTAEYRLHDLMQETDPEAFLAAHGHEFTGLVTSAPRGADAALIKALPNLQVISSFGVGLEKIDLAVAASQGVAVGYTPDVLNDCVADTAFGLVLDVMRGFSAADRFVRSGAWAAGQAYPLARKVSGQRLGLVGFGRIGQTIARRAAGFDMAVRYHSRRPVAGVPWLHEPSLLELAAWCDCLLVIVAGGAGTRHLINAPVLDALGSRGFLVNVSRGSVIDEPALVQALVNKRIAGAGLDVFENEPQVPADLLALDNVVLLPHIASATQETREAMAERVMANLASFFSTGQVMSAATP